ncbi:MAG: hypothetical protein NHB32_01005 [Fischerella sp. CENA71]|nr:hypothetical protein [Fischerella sp. CENA71]
MQVLDLENKELFREVSIEEFANVNGGGIITAAAYLVVLRAINPNLAISPVALNTAFLLAINALPAPGTYNSP